MLHGPEGAAVTRVFGLTGGIASGKSTVGRVFARRGVPVLDADQIARDIVKKGSPALAELAEAFGPDVLDANGELDRRALAAVAFRDEASRRTLNAITHPKIAMETRRRIDELHDPWVCYEAALLVENGLADAFRPLVVVAAKEPLQIRRVMARDGATEDEARARIRAQMPVETKVARADHVIWNEGSEEDLVREAERVLALIRDE